MPLTKVYNRINWENEPSIRSPLNETNLNLMDYGINEIDNRVITLESTKLEKADSYNYIKDISFDEATGEFTFTRSNNTQFKINTKLEKLAVNFVFDYQAQKLEITLDDGTKQYVDLSMLLSQYDFVDSDTIKVLTIGSGAQEQVQLEVIDGSITANKLQPNFLADCQQAQADSLDYAKLSKSWAIGGTITGGGSYTNNAKYYSDLAKGYAGQISSRAINYLGDFDSSYDYSELDACYYSGSTWVAKINSPSGVPTESDSWRYLARGVFKEVQFLTEVEYNALPIGKNTDDVVYFID